MLARPVACCPPSPNAPSITPPSPPVSVSGVRVLEPMTNLPTESEDKSVPLAVIPRLPSVSVEPAVSTAVGFAVMHSPATVAIYCSWISFSSGIELVSIIRANELSDMGVPDMVKRWRAWK